MEWEVETRDSCPRALVVRGSDIGSCDTVALGLHHPGSSGRECMEKSYVLFCASACKVYVFSSVSVVEQNKLQGD